MGYKELEEKIRTDFQKEIDAITGVSALETLSVVDEIKGEAKSATEKIKIQGEHKAELRYRQVVGKTKLDAMRSLNAEKSRLVDEVFDKAKAAILALPNSSKRTYINRLVDDGKLIDGGKVVRVDKHYKGLLEGDSFLKFIDDNLGDFGVVIESEDGLMRVDNRLGTIIAQAKVRLKPEVNKIIFG
ncbi:MAG: V-type ATP synthase subunit E [Candidatus Altiarchaeota archaeon]